MNAHRYLLALLLTGLTVAPATAAELHNLLLRGTRLAASPDADEAVVRTRPVIAALDELAQSLMVRIELFDGGALVLERVRTEPRGRDDYSWIGRVAGSGTGSALLVVRDGRLTGSLRADGRYYQVRPLRAGGHLLIELDPERLPPEGEPVAVDGERSGDGPLPAQLTDDGSIIDVLVVYTDDVAASVADAPALAQLGVDETNMAYEMSGIDQRLRLIDVREIDYAETGNSGTDLARLRSTSDGEIDIIHTWRNECAADFVSFWTEASDACGRGYLMTSVSLSFAANAFNVVKRSCATGNYSFGHELGHNMGAHHDRDNATAGAYPYSFGYRVPGEFRTVMAYACSPTCPRELHFSNPDVTFAGMPTGIPEGDPNAADNRKTLNNTAATCANFRDSATGCCPDDGYEPDDACALAARIVGGARQPRGFCDDAEDWLQFTACVGEGYTIETLALATAADTVLELYASDCTTLLATDDNGGTGLASRIDWIATVSDEHFVRVLQKDGIRGRDRGYDLELTGDTLSCGGCGNGVCNAVAGEGCATCIADCTPCEPSGLGTPEALRVVKGPGGAIEVHLENVDGETGYVLYEEAIGTWYGLPTRTCQPLWIDLGASVKLDYVFASGDRWIVAAAANANGESSCGQAWDGSELNQQSGWPLTARCP